MELMCSVDSEPGVTLHAPWRSLGIGAMGGSVQYGRGGSRSRTRPQEHCEHPIFGTGVATDGHLILQETIECIVVTEGKRWVDPT